MKYLFFLATVVSSIFAVTVRKAHTDKYSQGKYTFSAISVLSSLVFFVFTVENSAFPKELMFYAFGFAVCFALSTVSAYCALECGPLSLTALITAYSLFIPTGFGLLVWGEEFTILKLIAIILLAISISLLNIKTEGDIQAVLSMKWFILIIILFVSSGFTSVIQRLQQIAFDGQYDSVFMAISLTMVVSILCAIALIKEHKELKLALKISCVPAVLSGVATGMLNLCTMLCTKMFPASVFFPVLMASNIILSTLFGIFLFKEKLSKTQFTAIILGVICVVLMNI